MQANTVHCAKAWGYCGEFSGTLVAILPTGSCQRFLPKDLANQSFQINHTKSIFSNGSCQLGKCDPQPAVTQSGSGVTWDITSSCIICRDMTSPWDPLGACPSHASILYCTWWPQLSLQCAVVCCRADSCSFLLAYTFLLFCRHEVWLHRNGSLGFTGCLGSK